MDHNSILLGNLQIFEPVTVLTNILLAGFCFYWAGAAKGNTTKFWAWFFFLLGFSIFVGAFAHGMYEAIDNPAQKLTRVFALLAVSMGSLASVNMLENSKMKKVLIAFIAIQLISFGVMVIGFNKFIFVVIHSLIGLGVLVSLIFVSQAPNIGKQAKNLMLLGIGINASTAVIHAFKFSLHTFFNYNDIGHLILIVGCFFMYKAAQSAHIELSIKKVQEPNPIKI